MLPTSSPAVAHEPASFVDTLYRSPARVFFVLSTLLSLWYMFLPDIIPLHNGFAWEGEYYRRIAMSLEYNMFDIRINSYSIQRIFPFVILHWFFRGLGIPFTDANLILWMQVFNMLLGALNVYVWHRTARALGLSLAGEWIGFVALMVNFAFAKYDVYIPFTTDRLSATVGLLSLYFYVRRNSLALWLNALVSLSIWPTALAYNLLLLLIPYSEALPKTTNRGLSRAWAIAVALLFSGLFVGVLYVRKVPVPPRMTPDVHSLLPVGIVLTGLFLYYTQWTLARQVLPGWPELWALVRRTLRPRLEWLYVAVLLVAYVALTRVLGDPSRPYLPFKTFLINTTFAVLQRPLQFLVSHGVYYGLCTIVFCLFWRRVVAVQHRLGLGLALMFMIVMLQGINSETRQLGNVLPLLALVTALVAETFELRRAAVLGTAGLMFLISKAWLPFNWFDPTYGKPNDRFPSFSFVHDGFMLHWPFQVYFMNQGPWISNEYLIGQGLVLILVAWLVYRLFQLRRPAGPGAEAGASE
ncbi:hypothetical protein [Hymenobacter edaphi]|uniref:Glycosyltransferase RgtA/B/C/D-like domain-containing protein n=1 Tax=Hymenobacter edaphi TaxID=2211146 RepID=A0A328BFC5_9BACT|nr:hypothetical protein [Hymenobacter edaphi]RAK65773.1 hypothetical protein DLM85_13715 [Hymenobacter edaphi]